MCFSQTITVRPSLGSHDFIVTKEDLFKVLKILQKPTLMRINHLSTSHSDSSQQKMDWIQSQAGKNMSFNNTLLGFSAWYSEAKTESYNVSINIT